MKQVVQSYRTGTLRVEDVPAPICRASGVVVRAEYSLVSSGTERMKVSQARMNLFQMARARPDKMRQVLQSCKQIGWKETIAKVRERLDSLTPLGYSLVGTVEEVSPGLDEFCEGDRVACAGEGIACHAEFISVPRNLCVRVPEHVDAKDAAFATVGAIALNGVRQAEVTIGDTVLVVGLGLVGLLAVQILKAAGCQVIGVDIDSEKVVLAKRCGADVALVRSDPNLEEVVRQATGGVGPDVAYIAASAPSADPMMLAGNVLRDRGKVVIVGMVHVEADWQTYYRKELTVLMSRSYGPGRYERDYEMKGVDYPVGYVRWTLRRNLAEFLRLIRAGGVSPSLLAPTVFPISRAPEAYEQLYAAPERHVGGILFEYSPAASLNRRVAIDVTPQNDPNSRDSATPSASLSSTSQGGQVIRVGLIGCGNFATATLIPALKHAGRVKLRAVCSASGLSARGAAERHGFDYCASDVDQVLADDSIEAVIIATRHDTHARFAVQALIAGKHVYVEKPLALDQEQLEQLEDAQRSSPKILMPGFNRRFSHLATVVREFFSDHDAPLEINCRVNAGRLSSDSWYLDSYEGGWRIISEGCHFVDLIQYIIGADVEHVSTAMIGRGIPGERNENCISTLMLTDGSIASLVYVNNGDPTFDKERIEVFGNGRTAVIDHWRAAQLWQHGKKRLVKPQGSAKGHRESIAAFLNAIRGGDPAPIPFEQAKRTTLATFQMAASMTQRNDPLDVSLERQEKLLEEVAIG